MVSPYTEIVKQKSDCVISDPRLHISIKVITTEHFQDILKPELLASTYHKQALGLLWCTGCQMTLKNHVGF